MVWLETIEVKEGAEFFLDGERKPAFKVRYENHPLTGLRGGGQFIAGSMANHPGANPA